MAVLCWFWIVRAALGAAVSVKVLRIVATESAMAFGVVALFAFFTKKIDGNTLSQSALRIGRSPIKYFVAGAVTGGCMFCAVMFLLVATNSAVVCLNTEAAGLHYPFIVAMIAAVLCTAFWEEAVFRGYILPGLLKQYGVNVSCITVGIIFGGLHLLSPVKSPMMVLSTFFSGTLLSYAFISSGNILVPIGIHFAWNFLASFFRAGVFVDLKIYSPFMAGTHVFEEGWISIIVTAAMAALFALKTWRKDLSLENLSKNA